MSATKKRTKKGPTKRARMATVIEKSTASIAALVHQGVVSTHDLECILFYIAVATLPPGRTRVQIGCNRNFAE